MNTVKRILKHFTLLLLMASAQESFAQPGALLQPLKTLQVPVADIAVDNLDNIYLLTTTDLLKKYNAAGDSLSAYNDVRRFGKLHAIDVTNPLKLVLFYKDFSTIVILDRQLTVRTSIELRRKAILQPSAAGLSYDSNIWLFDEYDNKLKKINEEGTLLQETPDLRTVFGFALQPQQIIDQNNTVYLYDPKLGVFLFDHYGTFRKKLPITSWHRIAVWDKYIYGIDAHAVNFYNTATLLTNQKSLPHQLNGNYNYHVANNKLFAWTGDSLHIYTYPF